MGGAPVSDDRVPVRERVRVEAELPVLLVPLDRAAAAVCAAVPAELLGGVVREALPEVELAPRPEVAPTPRLLTDDAEIEGLL